MLQEEGRVPIALPCIIEKTEFSILDKAEDKANWRLKILSRNVDNFIDKVGKAISENGGMVHVFGLIWDVKHQLKQTNQNNLKISFFKKKFNKKYFIRMS